MAKLGTCLWVDYNKAEEMVKFYKSVFKGTKVLTTQRYGKDQMGPEGTVVAMTFKVLGHEFMALAGGPIFKPNEAISLTLKVKDQKELDSYWNKLLKDGGQEVQCGWLKDKFGFSWQIVPAELDKMVKSKNPRKIQAMMDAMLKMVKLDIKELKRAFNRVK